MGRRNRKKFRLPINLPEIINRYAIIITDMRSNDYQEIVNMWKGKPLKTGADVDTALDNFRVLFAYNSNKIENPETTYHDTREVFDNGRVTGYTGELRTLFEIQNQKNCYEYLKDKIVAGDEITPALIREVHRILMSGCYDESRWAQGERPGEYKLHDYVTGDGIGASPGETAAEIESLCEEIAGVPDDKALTAAAYFHFPCFPLCGESGANESSLRCY